MFINLLTIKLTFWRRRMEIESLAVCIASRPSPSPIHIDQGSFCVAH